jgi:hypothetical protein
MSNDYLKMQVAQSQTAAQQQFAAPPTPEETVTSLSSALNDSVSDLYQAIEALERDLSPVYVPCPVPGCAAGETIAPPAITQLRTLNAAVREASERIHRIRNGLRV